MLKNLFKREVDITKGKTTNQVIEEIHKSFDTEVESLLANAKILLSTETQLDKLIKKSEELKSLGFCNTKECKEAEIEIKRLEEVKKINHSKQALAEVIEYFSRRYPLNKFITEESVQKICTKYSLVYGPIDRYLGTVPDKNLKEMQNFRGKVKKEDMVYVCTEWNKEREDTRGYWNVKNLEKEYITRKEEIILANVYKQYPQYTGYSLHMLSNIGIQLGYDYRDSSDDYINSRLRCYKPAQWEIAAPQKDFNMEGYEVKGVKLSKIEIPDPVVLHPVDYKGNKYYLVVTAWGLEAGDELVVNKIFN